MNLAAEIKKLPKFAELRAKALRGALKAADPVTFEWAAAKAARVKLAKVESKSSKYLNVTTALLTNAWFSEESLWLWVDQVLLPPRQRLFAESQGTKTESDPLCVVLNRCKIHDTLVCAASLPPTTSLWSGCMPTSLASCSLSTPV